MKKIKDTFISVLILFALVYGSHKYTFLTLGGFSSAKRSLNLIHLRNNFISIPVKLDSLNYSESYGPGSQEPYIYLLSEINGEFFELYENPENIIAEIEHNGYSTQQVWFNKNYFNIFLHTQGEVNFPWRMFVFKYICITILFLSIPIIISYYLLKKIIKLFILIYKKDYYYVEDQE